MQSELDSGLVTTLQTLLVLLGVLVIAAVLARRLRISQSIVMVLAGCAMALVPGLPRFELVPEFVLLIALPPIIYLAGVQMSWRELRANLQPISFLAIGGVVFTTCVVALAAHYLLGLGWAIAFVLGAILSPPDTVAPLTILRGLGLPRRILVILEGEGLANDATALVLYRFAVAAVAVGVFSLQQVILDLVLIVVGELAYGIAIGWLGLHLRRRANDPHIEITLSLMTPYVAFWLPHHLGGSGVLATIAAGLYVSWHGPLLISSATRLQGIFFWDLLDYVVQGMVFLYTGLQMRTILEHIAYEDGARLLFATGMTTVVLVLARFFYLFHTALVRHAVRRWRGQRAEPGSWRGPFVIAFVGVRGVVSLAAALALPMTTRAGAAFPARDLILVVTFGVIVITLIGEGLVLPKVVRALGLDKGAALERDLERAQELQARTETLEAARKRLGEIAEQRQLAPETLQFVRTRHDEREQLIPSDLGAGLAIKRAGADLRMEAIAEERRVLHQMLRDGKLTDEARRHLERELDLEEAILGAREGE